ncbi:MAG: NAD(+) diphosphatase [Candidatus Zixiibacteriota bacterium]
MEFSSTHLEIKGRPAECLYFLFTGYDLIITDANKLIEDASQFGNDLNDIIHFGNLDGRPCYVGEFAGEIPAGYKTEHLRTTYHVLGAELFAVARHAFHIGYWHKTSKFCGICGASTEIHPKENAKICPVCKHMLFPRISPAVIVAVVRGNKILLARAKKFTRPIYSTLAGFVEMGENLEQCIHREIMEEVGITVKNIRYFGSQPWPFPNSLMIGFTAEHAGGEIELDENEMLEAGWFDKDHLPPGPDKMSIAYRLITWFVENH